LVARQLPQSEDAMSEQPQMAGSEATNPGDQVPPDVPGAGEALCPVCGGSGRIDGTACENCGGSGKIVEGIGGA
jgi:DnaJ-class molecular chaperone